MAENTTMTVRSDLRERLEALAAAQNQSVDEVLENLLPPPPTRENWALAFAEEMEAADIDWVIDPEASVKSRERYKQHVYEKWLRTQNQTDDAADG